jgi:phytoene dehydrogenase-like protein
MSDTHAYDAIVVGAGHNGLTHAAYLAKAGRRVLVLERRNTVGGAAITEELRPGIQVHHVLLRPEPAATRDHRRAGPGLRMGSCRC